MGAAISAMRDAVKEADARAEEKAKQDLEILEKMVNAQLDRYESELTSKFLTPDAVAKTEVPGIRALRKTRYSSTELSDTPAKDISNAIDSFFSIGSSGTDTNDALKAGFKAVVTSALSAFLGHTQIGQKEETKYFVYMHHNAVVRLDTKLWRWNFAGEGFASKYKQVVGYVICLSVVDVSVLKTSEFVYLISEYAGDSEEEVVKYCEKMGKLYKAARLLKQTQRVPDIED